MGPDLSALGKRSNVAEIAESIAAPDALIAEGFETNIVTVKDGTPHLGFVTADGPKEMQIKDSGGQIHRIRKKDIVSREPQSFSLMPPFDELLTPQQIADVAAFLHSQGR